MTLRKLWLMCQAKREYEGSLFAFLAAVVVAHIPFTGHSLIPSAINPYRRVSPEAAQKLEEVSRFISNMAFTVGAKEAIEKEGR